MTKKVLYISILAISSCGLIGLGTEIHSATVGFIGFGGCVVAACLAPKSDDSDDYGDW